MNTLTAQDLKANHQLLINLAERDIVHLSMDTTLDTIGMTKTETPEYQAVSHLAGKQIHISHASRKYEIPQQTISRWVKRGLITTLGYDKNRVLIDEADVAYCAAIYKSRPGAGKWLFSQDGSPYVPKRCE